MKLLGHRGYSAVYPENTVKAFKEAYECEFDGMETDVHMTKDGRLVLCHDETIDRTSNGTGYIKDMTLKELKEFDFKYNKDYDAKIPQLKTILKYVQDKDWVINVELKTDKIHYEGIEQRVYDEVQKYGVQDKVIYSSFYLPSLLKLQEIDPNVYLGYLMEDHYEERIEEARKHHIKAIHPRYDYGLEHNEELTKEFTVAYWTVNHREDLEKLKGAEYIISNKYLK